MSTRTLDVAVSITFDDSADAEPYTLQVGEGRPVTVWAPEDVLTYLSDEVSAAASVDGFPLEVA